MKEENTHYFSREPGGKIKIHLFSVSLRKHLYAFKTLPGVFSYKKLDLGTKVLIEHMEIPQEPSILLDLGCGYGSIGIVLARESPESTIYFVDINKRAIWCVKENIKLNFSDDRKQFVVLKGNYFNALKDKSIKFDGIYMNPPQRKGRKEFLSLYEHIPHYLRRGGSFQFVMRKKMGAPYIHKYLQEHHEEDEVDILCKRSGYWVFKCIFK
ncbi:MAG: class I SAM-dependent methyltransferase [Promethearchaeota archaeon]